MIDYKEELEKLTERGSITVEKDEAPGFGSYLQLNEINFSITAIQMNSVIGDRVKFQIK